MLIFGHTGITLGLSVLMNSIANRTSPDAEKRNRISKIKPFSFAPLAKRLDIRLLLVGSLLPDIIDKPIGQLFFKNTFNNGRIYAHTFLFLVLITLAGYFLYRSGKGKWLLVISFGNFMHLILDRIWLVPRTLFWPFFGFQFERGVTTDWIGSLFNSLFTKPEVYIPEIIGLIIMIIFLVVLVRRKKVFYFIARGKLE